MPIAFLRCLLWCPLGTFHYFRRGWPRFGWDIFRHFYLDAELILLSPHLIHFEFGALAAGKTYLGELLNCRIAASFRGHDINFCRLDEPAYYQRVWNQADAIHCLGHSLWSQAVKRGCPINKRHALIPPAVDCDFFSPHERKNSEKIGNSERPLRLLSVGRLNWTKGYEFALEAVKRLRDQGVAFECRIVGSGDYLEAVTFCRHQLDLEDCVQLLGALTQEEVREQMQWADIFLHAAVSEGFCNAVIEAQAMELPVVCTDADGLPENVQDGVTGFVVPRRSPQALAEKVLCLAGDPALRQRMGEAGRQRVFNCFRIEDQISAFETFYARTLESS